MLRQPPVSAGTWWPLAGWAVAAVLWFTMAHFLLGIPLQLSDSFGDLTQVQDRTVWQVAQDAFRPGAAYYRPLRWLQMKAVFDASDGRYYAWFKGVQLLQVALCLVLFVRLLRVRDRVDAAAACVALAVLVGLHTFNDTVRETFPINHFMMIVIACLAAMNVAISRGGWWADAAAVVLLVCAALTIESGLLVAVVVVAACLSGLPGISRRGMIAVGLLAALYVVCRFVLFDIGGPGLDERASGFGFRTIERSELPILFGDNPLPFYLYNVSTNLSSLFFSEPRSGVFVFVRSLVEGEMREWRIANVLSSALATAGIAWYVAGRLRSWRAGVPLDIFDRLTLTCIAVIGANAVIGYAYSKDVIMSAAGVCYALMAYAAARAMLRWLSEGRGVVTMAAFSLVLVVLGSAWSVRVIGLHWSLREQAQRVREDWATVDQDLGSMQIRLNDTGETLKQALQQDALIERSAPPGLRLPLLRRWFDEDY